MWGTHHQQWWEKNGSSVFEDTKTRWHNQAARIPSKVEFLILYIINANTPGILDMNYTGE